MGHMTRFYDEAEQKAGVQRTPAWAKPIRDHSRSAGVAIAVLVFVILILSAPLWVKSSHAGERHQEGRPPFQAGASSTATSSSTSSAGGAAASSAGGSQNVKAYGFGGTGLTSTAAHQGSVSVGWGVIATTYTDKGAVHRAYAEQLCPRSQNENTCFFHMACLDPDLGEDAKAFIGCKQP